MMLFRFFLLACMIGSISAACTYTGALHENFYRPQHIYDQKLPIKVAMVQNKRTKSQRFIYSGDYNVDIALYPGLIKAVKNEQLLSSKTFE